MTTGQLPDLPHDIELRLRRALLAQAEHDVPDSSTAPPVRWEDPTGIGQRRPHRRWLAPLLAAASIAALAVGLAISQAGARRGDPVPGATTGLTTSVVASGTDTVTSAAPHPTPSLPEGTNTPLPSGGGGPVRTWELAGGLSLGVLFDWAVWSNPAGQSGSSWCVGPNTADCRILFFRIEPTTRISTERMGGYATHLLKSCPAQAPEVLDEKAAVSLFGGRDSEYRSWSLSCQGSRIEVAQYVVAGPPGFVLFSEDADRVTAAVMIGIVKSSSLPKASGGLRYYDQGIVDTSTPTADGGADITLRRATGGSVTMWTYPVPTTSRYHLPAAVLPPGFDRANLTRQTLQVYTDGALVVGIEFPGG